MRFLLAELYADLPLLIDRRLLNPTIRCLRSLGQSMAVKNVQINCGEVERIVFDRCSSARDIADQQLAT